MPAEPHPLFTEGRPPRAAATLRTELLHLQARIWCMARPSLRCSPPIESMISHRNLQICLRLEHTPHKISSRTRLHLSKGSRSSTQSFPQILPKV